VPNTGPFDIQFKEEASNHTHAQLLAGGEPVSSLWISHHTVRIGESAVRMEGIGGVATGEAHRKQGYARSLLQAAVENMKRGDAALSMLYGIPDFYHRFGYATAGPDHRAFLTDLERDPVAPPGWTVRPLAPTDVPAVRSVYAAATAGEAGCEVRKTGGEVWGRLADCASGSSQDACRVAEGPDGQVHGYVWRAAWTWVMKYMLEPTYPDALALGEAVAESAPAADAVLAACSMWAREQDREVKRVVLAIPPQGPLAEAAMRQEATFEQHYEPSGGSMVRVLDVTRLMTALAPELSARARAAGAGCEGMLVFRTDEGEAGLAVTPDGVSVVDGGPSALVVELPQYELARLALGAYPPGSILERLASPPSEAACRLVEALFPHRHPHLYVPDRF
jgi:hypothetical protein